MNENNRKFSPENTKNLPHTPVGFFCAQKLFFAKVSPNHHNFANFQPFLSAQHARACPQHAQGLTLCPKKRKQILLEIWNILELVRQLLARDLGIQHHLLELSFTTSTKTNICALNYKLGLGHIPHKPCVFCLTNLAQKLAEKSKS